MMFPALLARRYTPGKVSVSYCIEIRSQISILDGDNFGDNFYHRDNFGIYPLWWTHSAVKYHPAVQKDL